MIGLAVARRLVFVVVTTFAWAAATDRLVVPSVTPNDHQMFPPVVRPVPVPLPLPQRMSAFGVTPTVCGTVWQPAASGLLNTPTSNSACACAGRGTLAAVDAAEGRLLWKRRARVLALAAAPGRLVALCGGVRPANLMLALDPHSGRVLWERPILDGSDATLCLWSDAALIVSGDRRRAVTAARLADGTRRFSISLPFAGRALLAGDEQVLIATGPGGAAARIDERGRVAWQLEPDGDSPAETALLQRGVALLHRRGALLCDAAAGHELALLASETPKLAAIADDMTVALVDQDDRLSVHRLATHLSIV